MVLLAGLKSLLGGTTYWLADKTPLLWRPEPNRLVLNVGREKVIWKSSVVDRDTAEIPCYPLAGRCRSDIGTVPKT